MIKTGPNWSELVQTGPNWSGLGWSRLVQSGPIWTSHDRSGRDWAGLGGSGWIWACLLMGLIEKSKYISKQQKPNLFTLWFQLIYNICIACIAQDHSRHLRTTQYHLGPIWSKFIQHVRKHHCHQPRQDPPRPVQANTIAANSIFVNIIATNTIAAKTIAMNTTATSQPPS